MKKALWLFEACIILVLASPIAVLPLRCAVKAGEFLGLLLFYAWGSRRKIAIDNLIKSVRAGGIAIAEPAEEVIKENFKNLGRSFSEVIKIYYGMGRKILDSVEIVDIENARKAYAKGKGIMLITGHCGNWELMALAASAKIRGVSVLARPLNNPYLNKFIERIRQKYGNNVIYKGGALRSMFHIFKEGGAVGILMDQSVIAEEGYIIDFLGRGAWTSKMPALLARKWDVSVIPVFIHREGNGHKITVFPEVELSDTPDKEKAVIEDTKNFSSYIEEYIRAHPTEWLWIHRKWKRV